MNKAATLVLILFNCIKLGYAVDIMPITDFKVDKYLGTWHEIARLPNRFEKKCIAPITAEYSIDSENENQLVVVNQCNTEAGKPEIAIGAAKFIGPNNIGKLKVTFVPKLLRWLQIGYGDYWILSVDYDKIAVVGSPDHKYLWILSRTNNVSDEDYTKALLIAKGQGFEVSKVIRNKTGLNSEFYTELKNIWFN